MSDEDRRLRLNLAATIVARLNREPGGLATMRRLMLDTRRGPSSATLDGSRGGHRHDTIVDAYGVFLAKIPPDPTGEAAIAVDPAEDALHDLDGALERLHAAVLDLAGLHDAWTPLPAPKVSDDDGFARDWCRSCWRIDRTCTPVTRRASGEPYYAGLCRWCGALRGELRMKETTLPPRALVAAHLAGDRTTVRRLKGHYRKDESPSRPSKGKRKRARAA